MSGRFADSFDHYQTANITQKWTNNLIPEASISAAPPAGRTAQAAFFVPNISGQTGVLTKTLDYQNNWIVGFAGYIVDSGGSSGTWYTLFNNGTILATLVVEYDSTLSVVIHNTHFNFAGLAVNANNWYYYELMMNLTPGGVGNTNILVNGTLRVNGVTLLTTGAQDTGVAITSTLFNGAAANRHGFSGPGQAVNGSYIDDLYICDGEGGYNNNFLGDVQVAALYPASDDGVDWSLYPLTPATHYTHVNQFPPPGDASYIYDAVAGDQDDFLWQNIASFTGVIPFVHYLLLARKDDEGSRSISHTIGGSVPAAPPYVPADPYSIGDTYIYYNAVYDTAPGDNPWTVALFNAQDFGVVISS